MLVAKKLLRNTQLWKSFDGDDDAYDAFSIHKLARGCEDALNACGLISYFKVTRWQQSASGDRMYVEGLLVVQSVDDKTDFIEVAAVGEGIDPGDKGLGKATSYARKNGLIQALQLGIGIDNEATPSSQQRQPYGPAPSGGSPQQATPKPQPAKTSPLAGTGAFFTVKDLKGGSRQIPIGGMLQECWAVIANSITVSSLNDWMIANADTWNALQLADMDLAKRISDLAAARVETLKARAAA